MGSASGVAPPAQSSPGEGRIRRLLLLTTEQFHSLGIALLLGEFESCQAVGGPEIGIGAVLLARLGAGDS